MLFHLASISLKIEIFQKIQTKSFKILFKKSALHSFLVILSLGLKIEYSYWNCTEFYKTLKPTMLNFFEKVDFLSVKLVFLSLIFAKTLNFVKFKINLKKVIFPSIFDMVCSKVIENSVHFQ